MEERKFARGQKRIEAANIMLKEGERHRIDSIRCVPPPVAKEKQKCLIIFNELTSGNKHRPDIQAGRCQVRLLGGFTRG